MKTLASLILLLFSVQSLAFELPIGDFQFTNTQAFRTKHVHMLYQKSAKEKKLISDYRANGYTCKPRSSSFFECSKFIRTNPNYIEFKVDKLEKLSPLFSSTIKNIEVLSSGELVTVYEITQENSSNLHDSLTYKMYDNGDRGLYIDVHTSEVNKARFKVISPKLLVRSSYQKEKLNKREFYIHSLSSYYIK